MSPSRTKPNARFGFFIHLAAFLIVNAVLIGINLATFRGTYWFQWPLLGWGIGVAAHAGATYVLPLFLAKSDKHAVKR